jgi:ketosteroid isomerase-like protein
MTSRDDLLDLSKRYFRALEEGDRAALEEVLHPAISQEELPNRLRPQGGQADRAAMLTAFERGKSVVRQQRYDIETALVEGDRIALQVLWTATLNVAIGSLAAGDTMRAHFAVFLEVQGGRIVSQRNYDCFDPF